MGKRRQNRLNKKIDKKQEKLDMLDQQSDDQVDLHEKDYAKIFIKEVDRFQSTLDSSDLKNRQKRAQLRAVKKYLRKAVRKNEDKERLDQIETDLEAKLREFGLKVENEVITGVDIVEDLPEGSEDIEAEVYKVKSGETLLSIVEREFEVSVDSDPAKVAAIMRQLNDLRGTGKDPNKLRAGEVLFTGVVKSMVRNGELNTDGAQEWYSGLSTTDQETAEKVNPKLKEERLEREAEEKEEEAEEAAARKEKPEGGGSSSSTSTSGGSSASSGGGSSASSGGGASSTSGGGSSEPAQPATTSSDGDAVPEDSSSGPTDGGADSGPSSTLDDGSADSGPSTTPSDGGDSEPSDDAEVPADEDEDLMPVPEEGEEIPEAPDRLRQLEQLAPNDRMVYQLIERMSLEEVASLQSRLNESMFKVWGKTPESGEEDMPFYVETSYGTYHGGYDAGVQRVRFAESWGWNDEVAVNFGGLTPEQYANVLNVWWVKMRDEGAEHIDLITMKKDQMGQTSDVVLDAADLVPGREPSAPQASLPDVFEAPDGFITADELIESLPASEEILAKIGAEIEKGDAIMDTFSGDLHYDELRKKASEAKAVYTGLSRELSEFISANFLDLKPEDYDALMYRVGVLNQRIQDAENFIVSAGLEEVADDWPQYFVFDGTNLAPTLDFDALPEYEQKIIAREYDVLKEGYYLNSVLKNNSESLPGFISGFYEGELALANGEFKAAKEGFVVYLGEVAGAPDWLQSREAKRVELAEQHLRDIAHFELSTMRGYLQRMRMTFGVDMSGELRKKRKLDITPLEANMQLGFVEEGLDLCEKLIAEGKVQTVEEAIDALNKEDSLRNFDYRERDHVKHIAKELRRLDDGPFDVFDLIPTGENRQEALLRLAKQYRKKGLYDMSTILFEQYYEEEYETLKKNQPELDRANFEKAFDENEGIQKKIDKTLKKGLKERYIEFMLATGVPESEKDKIAEEFDPEKVPSEVMELLRENIRQEALSSAYEKKLHISMCEWMNGRDDAMADVWNDEFNDMMEFDAKWYNVFTFTDAEWDSFVQDLPIDLIITALSFGTASASEKAVTKFFLKKAVRRKLVRRMAKEAAEEEIEQALKRGGIAGLKKLAAKNGVGLAVRGGVTATAFTVENIAFVTAHGSLNGLRTGDFHTFSSWSAFGSELGHSFVTLGTLKVGGAGYARLFGNAGKATIEAGGARARAVMTAHATGSVAMQTGLLTGVGVAGMILEGAELDDATVRGMVRSNAVMSVAFAAGGKGRELAAKRVAARRAAVFTPEIRLANAKTNVKSQVKVGDTIKVGEGDAARSMEVTEIGEGVLTVKEGDSTIKLEVAEKDGKIEFKEEGTDKAHDSVTFERAGEVVPVSLNSISAHPKFKGLKPGDKVVVSKAGETTVVREAGTEGNVFVYEVVEGEGGGIRFKRGDKVMDLEASVDADGNPIMKEVGGGREFAFEQVSIKKKGRFERSVQARVERLTDVDLNDVQAGDTLVLNVEGAEIRLKAENTKNGIKYREGKDLVDVEVAEVEGEKVVRIKRGRGVEELPLTDVSIERPNVARRAVRTAREALRGRDFETVTSLVKGAKKGDVLSFDQLNPDGSTSTREYRVVSVEEVDGAVVIKLRSADNNTAAKSLEITRGENGEAVIRQGAAKEAVEFRNFNIDSSVRRTRALLTDNVKEGEKIEIDAGEVEVIEVTSEGVKVKDGKKTRVLDLTENPDGSFSLRDVKRGGEKVYTGKELVVSDAEGNTRTIKKSRFEKAKERAKNNPKLNDLITRVEPAIEKGLRLARAGKTRAATAVAERINSSVKAIKDLGGWATPAGRAVFAKFKRLVAATRIQNVEWLRSKSYTLEVARTRDVFRSLKVGEKVDITAPFGDSVETRTFEVVARDVDGKLKLKGPDGQIVEGVIEIDGDWKPVIRTAEGKADIVVSGLEIVGGRAATEAFRRVSSDIENVADKDVLIINHGRLSRNTKLVIKSVVENTRDGVVLEVYGQEGEVIIKPRAKDGKPVVEIGGKEKNVVDVTVERGGEAVEAVGLSARRLEAGLAKARAGKDKISIQYKSVDGEGKMLEGLFVGKETVDGAQQTILRTAEGEVRIQFVEFVGEGKLGFEMNGQRFEINDVAVAKARRGEFELAKEEVDADIEAPSQGRLSKWFEGFRDRWVKREFVAEKSGAELVEYRELISNNVESGDYLVINDGMISCRVSEVLPNGSVKVDMIDGKPGEGKIVLEVGLERPTLGLFSSEGLRFGRLESLRVERRVKKQGVEAEIEVPAKGRLAQWFEGFAERWNQRQADKLERKVQEAEAREAEAKKTEGKETTAKPKEQPAEMEVIAELTREQMDALKDSGARLAEVNALLSSPLSSNLKAGDTLVINSSIGRTEAKVRVAEILPYGLLRIDMVNGKPVDVTAKFMESPNRMVVVLEFSEPVFEGVSSTGETVSKVVNEIKIERVKEGKDGGAADVAAEVSKPGMIRGAIDAVARRISGLTLGRRVRKTQELIENSQPGEQITVVLEGEVEPVVFEIEGIDRGSDVRRFKRLDTGEVLRLKTVAQEGKVVLTAVDSKGVELDTKFEVKKANKTVELSPDVQFARAEVLRTFNSAEVGDVLHLTLPGRGTMSLRAEVISKTMTNEGSVTIEAKLLGGSERVYTLGVYQLKEGPFVVGSIKGEGTDYFRVPGDKFRLEKAESHIETLRRTNEGLRDQRDYETAIKRSDVARESALGIVRRAEVHGTVYRGERLTVGALERLGLEPVTTLEFDGATVHLSRPYSIGHGRVARVMYVESGGKVVARSIYKSNSSMSWRLLANYTTTVDGDIAWYGKGHSEESITLPAKAQAAISEYDAANGGSLVDVAAKGVNPDLVLAGTTRFIDPNRSITDTVLVEVDGRATYVDGTFKNSSPEGLRFRDSMNEPDFSKLVHTYKTGNGTYGEVTVEVFLSRDGKYKYSFARDARNRVWIMSGEVVGSKMRSAGVSQQWLDLGDMQMPAYEYWKQIDSKYHNHADISADHNYVDTFQNFGRKIPVIQRYGWERLGIDFETGRSIGTPTIRRGPRGGNDGPATGGTPPPSGPSGPSGPPPAPRGPVESGPEAGPAAPKPAVPARVDLAEGGSREGADGKIRLVAQDTDGVRIVGEVESMRLVPDGYQKTATSSASDLDADLHLDRELDSLSLPEIDSRVLEVTDPALEAPSKGADSRAGDVFGLSREAKEAARGSVESSPDVRDILPPTEQVETMDVIELNSIARRVDGLLDFGDGVIPQERIRTEAQKQLVLDQWKSAKEFERVCQERNLEIFDNIDRVLTLGQSAELTLSDGNTIKVVYRGFESGQLKFEYNGKNIHVNFFGNLNEYYLFEGNSVVRSIEGIDIVESSFAGASPPFAKNSLMASLNITDALGVLSAGENISLKLNDGNLVEGTVKSIGGESDKPELVIERPDGSTFKLGYPSYRYNDGKFELGIKEINGRDLSRFEWRSDLDVLSEPDLG